MPLKKQTTSTDSLDLAPYGDLDSEQFEVLNEQIKSRQTYSIRVEKMEEKSVRHSFSYSENDAAQFQKILTKSNATEREESSRSAAQSDRGFGNSYKQSDDDQFQALMDFNMSQPRDCEPKSALSINDGESFSHSEQDLRTFNQLEHGDQTDTNDTVSQIPSHSERDIGHIKIMEFDGNTKKPNKAPRQSNLNIKVRYFD